MAFNIKEIVNNIMSADDHPEIRELFEFINNNATVDLKKLQSQYTLEQLIAKTERIRSIYGLMQDNPLFSRLIRQRAQTTGTYSHGMNYA